MYNEPLKSKAYDKLKEATLVYAERMYVKIGELQNVCGYITKEQFNDLKKVKCYPVRYVYNGRYM